MKFVLALGILFFSLDVVAQLSDADLDRMQRIADEMASLAENMSADDPVAQDKTLSRIEELLRELIRIYKKDPAMAAMIPDLEAQLEEVQVTKPKTVKSSPELQSKPDPKPTGGGKCEQLVAYRDGPLFADFDKAYNKHNLYSSLRSDLMKWRSELLEDSKWARTEASVYVAAVAQVTKTTTDLINGLLSLTPAGYTIGTASFLSVKWAERVQKSIEAGEMIATAVDDGVETAAYQILLDNMGPVGKSVNIIKTTADNILKFEEINQGEVDKLRKEVANTASQYDAAIAAAERKMKTELDRMNSINQIKEGIDVYLRKNCK